MKRFTWIIILLIFSIASFSSKIKAEIVHTKDGQILKGTIVREDEKYIYLKTKYQTRKIHRKRIRRILYGDRAPEKIHITLKNGDTMSGYLIDQDSVRVYMKSSVKSRKEIIVLKKDILQMSTEELIPFNPEIDLRVGWFMPYNNKGAELDPSIIYLISYGFNLPWFKNTRMSIEGGYTKLLSGETDGQYMQIVPITANIRYSFDFKYLSLVPKIGTGIAIVEFNDGEGHIYQGYDNVVLGGLGIKKEIIKRTFALSLWLDYFVIIENSSRMNNIVLAPMIHYYF